MLALISSSAALSKLFQSKLLKSICSVDNNGSLVAADEESTVEEPLTEESPLLLARAP